VTRAPSALSPALAGPLAAVAGFVGWAAFSLGETRREAWDSGPWWVVALPLLALTAGILGYLVPGRTWRWAAAIIGGQVAAMLAFRPEGAGLGLFPLTVVFILAPQGVVLGLAAFIGGRATAAAPKPLD
jgi:hypothetical protein